MALTRRQTLAGLVALGTIGVAGGAKLTYEILKPKTYTEVENITGKLAIPEGNCAIIYTPEKNLPSHPQWISYSQILKKKPGFRILRVMPENEEGKKINNGKEVTILYREGKQIERINGNIFPGLLDSEINIHFYNKDRNLIPYFPLVNKYPAEGCCNLALKPGDMAPEFEAKTLDNKEISIKNERGNILYLEFWATWCGPCIGHIPKVKQLHEKYSNKGVKIIGISLDHELETLENFVKEKKIPYPVVFDGKGIQGPIAKKYQIAGIPQAYLIDKEGVIKARSTPGEKEIEALLN